jgi:hypothetical protein
MSERARRLFTVPATWRTDHPRLYLLYRLATWYVLAFMIGWLLLAPHLNVPLGLTLK